MSTSSSSRPTSPSVSDVAVVTVNWNGRGHLETLFQSLARLQAGQVLMVDNGSTDGSVEFVRKRFPWVSILANQENLGFASPCNRGAERAERPIIAFINNDMRCHPEWLRAGLAEFPHAPCVASRILDWKGERIDYNGSSLQYLGYAVQRDIGEPADRVSHPRQVLFPCGGAMIVDRELFLELGGFDEDYFAIYEDVDFGWRLWVAGHEVRYAPNSIVYHRSHATFETQSLARMRYLMHRNALFTIIKNYEEESYRRIVPLAVALAIKRAVRCSGVNRESFYLWAERAEALKLNDAHAQSETLDALNHLVSLDDVFDRLPSLLEKRRRVQALRKRKDAEIFSLFEDPLRPIVLDAEYMSSELELIRHLRLDEFFSTDNYQRAMLEAPNRTLERVRRTRQELDRVQQAGTQALLHPPLPGRSSRIQRLLDTVRDEGFGAAARKVWRTLRGAS